MEIFEPTKFNFEIESSSSNWIFQTGELQKSSANKEGLESYCKTVIVLYSMKFPKR